MTYSFDVFDTCLARKCGSPQNVFEVLSKRVVNLLQLPIEDQEHIRQLFVALRIELHGRLENVYSEMAKSISLPCSITEMVRLELETERDMLVPIEKTRQIVQACRKKGEIIYISDMYLPSLFITEQLKAHGFYHDGDKVFVSDEYGASKRTGDLFRLIHKKYNTKYREWHHWGDNRMSDFKIPRQLGIHAHWIHYDYLSYEKKWMEIPVLQFPWPSITAGISRATRLQSTANYEQSAFVSDISAPVMASWVCKILKDAQTRGITDIYFCSRDCHTEYLMALRLNNHFPSLAIHYLFISGTACKSELFYNYLQQEGIASPYAKVAIVDSNSTSKTHHLINSMLKQHGDALCHSYLLCRRNIHGIPSSFSSLLHTETMRYYTTYNFIPYVRKSMNEDMIELFFSINCHLHVDGYYALKEKIIPFFGKDEVNTLSCDTIKKIKPDNDSLAIHWMDSIITTNCIEFAERILDTIALPSLGHFCFAPQHPYIDYLQYFKRSNLSYIKRLTPFNPTGRGSYWKRGSLAFTLPKFIGNHLYDFLTSKIFRIICLFKGNHK